MPIAAQYCSPLNDTVVPGLVVALAAVSARALPVPLPLLAVFAMLPYSIYFKLYPIIIANLSVGLCNSIIIYYKLQNRYIKNIHSNFEEI